MASILLRQIQNLRAKPEHHRRAWAAGLSIGFTSIIAIIWAINLSLTVSSSATIAKQEPKASPFAQVAGVAASNIGAVKDGVVTVFSDLFSLFGD